MPNAHVKLQSCMERISVDEFGLQACSLRLLPPCRFRLQCASLSLSYHFFHRDWLHGWLQILVITGQVAKMSWSGLRYPAIYCQRRIITFWYPLNWRWMFSQSTQIISLLQSSWPAPQFRCSLVKKGMRWISLRIRKRKKREEVNMAANQETPSAELSSSLCRWVNLAIYYSDQGGEHCLHSTLFTLIAFYSAKNTRNLWLILLLPIWSEFLLGALHILRNTGWGSFQFMTILSFWTQKVRSYTIHFQL